MVLPSLPSPSPWIPLPVPLQLSSSRSQDFQASSLKANRESRIDGVELGAIDRHKSEASYKPPSRTNVYVNPNYKPPSHSTQVPSRPAPYHRPAPIKNTGEKRDVVLNGVAFQSSARSLVRKDREYTLGKCGLHVLLTYPLSTSTHSTGTPDPWGHQLQARS